MAEIEKQLPESIYRDFFESARFPMLLIDEDRTILLCNKAFENLSGYSRYELEGKRKWDIIVALNDELERMINFHIKRRIDPTLAPGEYEFKLKDASGNVKDIALNINMLPGTKMSLAFLQDITEKKQTETWYKAVFENTGLPSIIIAPDTTIVKANTEWALLSGYSIEENEGKLSWTQFVDKEDLEKMKTYHRARRDDASAAPRKYEFKFIRRNGEVRNIINSVTMIPDSPYSIASLMDITDLREAEAERKKLEDQLQQARKLESIGQLAGGVAHDFNNMLAAILGYSQMVQIKLKNLAASLANKKGEIAQTLDNLWKDGESSTGRRESFFGNVISSMMDFLDKIDLEIENLKSSDEMIDEVIKASKRAGELTKQLLAFARKQTLELKPININSVIENFEKMLRRTIRENIQIELHLSEGIETIEADTGQIEQVILNLALNGQDAMPDGGKLIIRTENKMLDSSYANSHEGVFPGRYVMLEISDTGVGMDKDIQSKIFEPFFTTKEKGMGTGLGLATVYGIVKQHAGSIWLYSEKGKGTSFHIYFPISAKKVNSGECLLYDINNYGTETILVVEDQEQVRKMTSVMLRQKGYKVFDAATGDEALKIASSCREKIDLVITDVVMPGMNGKELYNEIAKIIPDVDVLFVSGYPMEIISHHGILEEGLNFLSKPVTIDDFTKKIRDILDKKKCL